MEKTLKKIASKKIALLTVTVMLLLSTSAFYQHTPWKAPASADAKKNPLSVNPAIIEAGKVIYTKHCLSCHGKKGKGDGRSAATLNTEPGDFTTEATQGQSDGALFWKIEEGRKDMPTFKKKLTEEEAWQVVAYTRTLK